MLNKELIIRRLALIKYLYQRSIADSYQPEPTSSFAILGFHDSIEMFLKLCAENKNIKTDKFNFIEYWTVLELTLKESCNALNARRVNIKHKGLLPSKSDIESSRVTTTDFFEQNTYSQFQIHFKEVSTISLINNTEVKENLEKAVQFLNKNQYQESVNHSAFAFDDLLSSYENNKKGNYYSRSPFFFETNLYEAFLKIENKELSRLIDKMTTSLTNTNKTIKILSLGIDYRKYTKFSILTPNVTKFIGGKRQLSEAGWVSKKLNKNNCQFCIDFILDAALKFQEFDFDISDLIGNDEFILEEH